MGFEVVGGAITERGMAAFSVVIDHVVADCKPGFGQTRKLALVGQFGFRPAPERFGAGIVVAVATPAPTLLGHIPNRQVQNAVADYGLPWA